MLLKPKITSVVSGTDIPELYECKVKQILIQIILLKHILKEEGFICQKLYLNMFLNHLIFDQERTSLPIFDVCRSFDN
jgi:hypothetical protein